MENENNYDEQDKCPHCGSDDLGIFYQDFDSNFSNSLLVFHRVCWTCRTEYNEIHTMEFSNNKITTLGAV